MSNRLVPLFLPLLLTILAGLDARAPLHAAEPELSLVVMDPLAAPLACDCVAGYAQRQYHKLADHLHQRLGRPVKLAFAASLERGPRKPDLIIGKHSVVRADAAEVQLSVRPLAMLTGLDGKTTQTGLFVVPHDDPAQAIKDLKGYTVFFGPREEEEKHAAAVASLKAAGVAVSYPPKTCPSCAEAGLEVLEFAGPGRAAGVLSSYAKPLLEGCGSIDPGSLRVVGKTEPVAFITVFAAASVGNEDAKKILRALQAVGDNPALLKALESQQGFLPVEATKRKAASGEGSSTHAWPGFRGPRRNAVVPWLPEQLPAKPLVAWKTNLTGDGLAGLAATDEIVIVADRDSADMYDLFRCLDAKTGASRWTLKYTAQGDLDYGNSPRATPLIHDGHVFLFGAFGHLHCVHMSDGQVIWKRHLPTEFHAKLPTWGYCSSPLLVNGKLIVNPGARDASVVALDAANGETVWQSPGRQAAYASFIAGTFGGVPQIVGYDALSLGGWDAQTGRRLWTLLPPESGDFNVPTPIDAEGRLLVSTENNGTRLYEFNLDGTIRPEPAAETFELAPDMTTPVLVGGKVYGASAELFFCLALDADLHTVGSLEDACFEDYVSILATDKRLLVTTCDGQLLLIRTDRNRCELAARQRITDEDSEVYAHPALVGTRLYVRDDRSIFCLELASSQAH